jgi:hypothetical protein
VPEPISMKRLLEKINEEEKKLHYVIQFGIHSLIAWEQSKKLSYLYFIVSY